MTTSLPFDRRRGWFILAATIIGAGMVYLDGTIITVALEPIRQEFKASVSDLQWLLDIYLLFLTIPILVSGSLSDYYGRKRLFNIGLIGFTTASAACALSGSMNQLNIARAFQGAFGGIMLPGSLAILNATFPPEMRGKTIGTWSAFTALTTAIGPLLGGWLVDGTLLPLIATLIGIDPTVVSGPVMSTMFASWRAAFYINVPLGLTALAFSIRYIPESRSHTIPDRQDWLGVTFVTFGLGGLMYGLIEGPVHNWDEPIYFYTFIAGIILLVLFAILETRIAHPMIPISLLKYRLFAGISMLTLLLYFSMSGVFFFVPLLVQQTHDFSATRTGVLLIPLILLLSVMSRWAGNLADKSGPRQLLIAGPTLIAISLFLAIIPGPRITPWFAFLEGLSQEDLTLLAYLPATIIFGLGLGLTVAPLTTVALGAVPRHMSGLASGFSNAISRVATILAVAILGAVMLTQFTISFEKLTLDLPLSAEQQAYLQIEKLKLGAAKPPSTMQPELAAQVQAAIDQSFVDGFRLMMALCGTLALLGTLVTIFTIEDKIIAHDEHHLLNSELEVMSPPHL